MLEKSYSALLCPIFGGKAGMNYIIDCVDDDMYLSVNNINYSEFLLTGLKGSQGCWVFRAPCHGLRRLVSRPVTP